MTLLEVDDLVVDIGGRRVVDGVSFELADGGRLGVIGESGSGKTLTALSIVGLAPDAATVTGSVRFDGEELLGRPDRRYAELRGDRIAMVFQDPRTALNPVMRVGRQISEPLRLHRGLGRRSAARSSPRSCANGSACPIRSASCVPTRTSSPAASASGSGSPWRWPAGRRC